MKKIGLLTKSNLRTSKGSSICVGVLLFVAVMLFNLALILVTDYKNNFYRVHDELNCESVTVVVSTADPNYDNYINTELKNDSKVMEYESSDCYGAEIKLPFRDDSVQLFGAIMNYTTAINKTVGKIEMIGDTLDGEGIYLPYLFYANECRIGDVIDVTIGVNNNYTFKVLGFYNSVMTGSNNCAITLVCFSDETYTKVINDLDITNKAYYLSIKLVDKYHSASYQGYIDQKLEKNLNVYGIISNSFELIANSRYITQKIASLVIMLLAVLIMVIALVISVANISEYIKENMKKIGALKALGYTSVDLIFSFLLQFSTISLIAGIVGASSSYLLLPGMNSLLISQTGIPYQISFQVVPFILTIVIFTFFIIIAILFSSLKVRKIDAIVALRNGITTHSFKRNAFPLEANRFNVNIRLGLKTAVNNIRGNITTIITTFVLAFVLVFDIFLFFNAVISFDPMIKLICAVTPDGIIYTSIENEKALVNDLENDERVEKYFLYSETSASCLGETLSAKIVENGKYIDKDLMIEGRAPLYDNEIGIGAKFCYENGFKVGDTVAVSINGIENKFIISGFTQNSDYLGKDCVITRKTMEKINASFNICYYIYNHDVNTIDDVLNFYQAKYEDTSILNYKKTSLSFTNVYERLMSLIFIGIIIITLLVIAFVLFLLVRSLIDKKKKEFGILKSVGYTTSDLILQVILSFVPALLIGSLLGSILGYFLMNPCFGLAFRTLGIYECNLEVPFISVIIIGLLLVLTASAIIYLVSYKTKKIEVYELLTTE